MSTKESQVDCNCGESCQCTGTCTCGKTTPADAKKGQPKACGNSSCTCAECKCAQGNCNCGSDTK